MNLGIYTDNHIKKNNFMEQLRNLDKVMETENHFKNGISWKIQMSSGNLSRKKCNSKAKKLFFTVLCILFTVQTHAVQITVDGITYDDFNSSIIHEGLYRNVAVVGISSNFEGDLVIPALPAQFGDGVFYFRVTEIKSDVFKDNIKLTSLTLPNTLTSIEDWTFSGCTNLIAVTIPSGIIKNCAFYVCTKLSSVTLGAGVTSIGEDAFGGCVALTSFEVAAGNMVYTSLDGVLYNKNQTTLVCFPAAKQAEIFSIPNTVVDIADFAFYSSTLKSVIIPNGTTSIGWGAFGESSLQSVIIAKSVQLISEMAFKHCEKLTDITVFWNTPSEVTTNFFEEDGIVYDIFLGIDKSTVKLHVPLGTKASYQASNIWQNFNIFEDADPNTNILNTTTLSLSLYPNPTRDHFIVDCESLSQVKIYDMLGKEILTQNSNGKTEININHLPKGVYNVRILSEGKVIGNSKIVKQ